LAKGLQNLASSLLAKMEAQNATLERTKVAARPLFRHVHEAQPIASEIELCSRLTTGRHDRRQVQVLPRLRFYARRVDQTITTYENLVVHARQLGNNVLSFILGDHAANKAGGKLHRFRDDP